MIEKVYGGDTMSVAPFTGAWIEIFHTLPDFVNN